MSHKKLTHWRGLTRPPSNRSASKTRETLWRSQRDRKQMPGQKEQKARSKTSEAEEIHEGHRAKIKARETSRYRVDEDGSVAATRCTDITSAFADPFLTLMLQSQSSRPTMAPSQRPSSDPSRPKSSNTRSSKYRFSGPKAFSVSIGLE